MYVCVCECVCVRVFVCRGGGGVRMCAFEWGISREGRYIYICFAVLCCAYSRCRTQGHVCLCVCV